MGPVRKLSLSDLYRILYTWRGEALLMHTSTIIWIILTRSDSKERGTSVNQKAELSVSQTHHLQLRLSSL